MLGKAALLSAGVLIAATSTTAVRAQESIPITISSGYPTTFVWTASIKDVFVPTVDKLLKESGNKYKIEWTEAYGGQLGAPADQGDLVQTGAADIANVVLPVEQDILPLESVPFIVAFGTNDIALATRAVHDMHKTLPEFNEAWTKAGMKYLSAVALDNYQIMSRAPMLTVDDVNGKKIGAVGLNQNWLKNTGAIPVSVVAVRVYNDLQTGVIDGVISTPSMMKSGRYEEVARHITIVNFGSIYQLALGINLDRWENFPPPVQDAIQKAADEWMVVTVQRLAKAEADALAYFKEKGVEVHEMTLGERSRWAHKIPNVPLEWAGKSDIRLKVLTDYINTLKAGGTQFPRDWLAKN